MREMRKLMEAVQLNEYFTRPGDPYDEATILNLFGDMLEGEFYAEESDEDVPEWRAIEKKYRKVAVALEKKLKLASKAGKKFSNADSAMLDAVMYEGSDLYDDYESMVSELPNVYDEQIRAVCRLLKLKEPAWLSEATLDEAGQSAVAPVKKDSVVAQAGEFKVVRDTDGMVHITDGEQNIRLSMFSHEWDDLIASYDNGDYIGD